MMKVGIKVYSNRWYNKKSYYCQRNRRYDNQRQRVRLSILLEIIQKRLFKAISEFCIIASTMIFTIIYMLTGIDAAGRLIDYTLLSSHSVGFITILSDFGKCLFFSVTTFSTVGYGNYVTIGTLSMIISGVHMIIGVSLCALWTGCIFRKIVR